MKKQFVFLAVTAGLFTSCVQNDLIVPELSEAEKEIKFQTVVEKHQTRAIITGVDYDSGAPSFGTYATLNPQGLTPGIQEHVPPTEIAHHDETNHTTHFWAPKDESEHYYWPPAGSLTFFSYSPFWYQESAYNSVQLDPKRPIIGTAGFVFENYEVDKHQETDLMVAKVQVGQTANINHGGSQQIVHAGVPTIFSHKLALIAGFKLYTSENYGGGYDGINDKTAPVGAMRFLIKSINLKNVPIVGTFASEGVNLDGSSIKEQWTIVKQATQSITDLIKDYPWFNVENSAEEVVFGYETKNPLYIYKPEVAEPGLNLTNPSIDLGYILVIPQLFESGSTAELEVIYRIQTKTDAGWEDTKHNPDGTPNTTDPYLKKTMPFSQIHGDKDAEGNFIPGGWGIGKKITYTLEFSTEEIRWAPSIVEWTQDPIKIDF